MQDAVDQGLKSSPSGQRQLHHPYPTSHDQVMQRDFSDAVGGTECGCGRAWEEEVNVSGNDPALCALVGPPTPHTCDIFP